MQLDTKIEKGIHEAIVKSMINIGSPRCTLLLVLPKKEYPFANDITGASERIFNLANLRDVFRFWYLHNR